MTTSRLAIQAIWYHWSVLIFMIVLPLGYVSITKNIGTYYEATFLAGTPQVEEQSPLFIHNYFHACSINSTCNYVVKNTMNQVNMYSTKEEIPTQIENLAIWKKRIWSYVYRIFLEKRTWFEAREVCKLHNGDLASITSKQEEDKIKELLAPYVNNEGFWFGLNDLETEGTYLWSDGSEYNYKNWRHGEPNNIGNEDCMISGLVMTWVDGVCSGLAYFICKVPVP